MVTLLHSSSRADSLDSLGWEGWEGRRGSIVEEQPYYLV